MKPGSQIDSSAAGLLKGRRSGTDPSADVEVPKQCCALSKEFLYCSQVRSEVSQVIEQLLMIDISPAARGRIRPQRAIDLNSATRQAH